MKIVFHNRRLISGGIEKCLELLTKELYKDYEIDIVYSDDDMMDPNIVEILKRYANVYKLEKEVECDVCIFCYLYFDYPKLKSLIKAKKYIAWIHSMPRILPDCLLDNQDFINDMSEIVCVSEAVQKHLDVNKSGIVIHNFMERDIKELGKLYNPFEGINADLKIAVVSRLSTGKGFDRLLLLVKALEKRNINYHIKIVGKGRNAAPGIMQSLKPYKNVEFVGYRENPFPFVKHADYLAQLSDDESWCNSITEAKLLGTPVIVTNFESSKEQIKDLENGIIVDLNDTDYDKYIDKILTNKTRLKANLIGFEYKNDIEAWKELINKNISAKIK